MQNVSCRILLDRLAAIEFSCVSTVEGDFLRCLSQQVWLSARENKAEWSGVSAVGLSFHIFTKQIRKAKFFSTSERFRLGLGAGGSGCILCAAGSYSSSQGALIEVGLEQNEVEVYILA